MLDVIPHSMLSWRFDVRDGRRLVATVDFAWLRESGLLDIDDQIYEIHREGLVSGDWCLECQGRIVARAEKLSAFSRVFDVEHEGRHFELRAAGAFRREFLLTEDGRRRGSLRPKSMFSRRSVASFSEDIPLAVRVFLVWLTLLLWRRQQNAAHAS